MAVELEEEVETFRGCVRDITQSIGRKQPSQSIVSEGAIGTFRDRGGRSRSENYRSKCSSQLAGNGGYSRLQVMGIRQDRPTSLSGMPMHGRPQRRAQVTQLPLLPSTGLNLPSQANL